MAQCTIKDLARALGVSPSTVSRALHGHPDISEATRERVAEAAKKFHYQPNLLAKSLQQRQSNTIGVIVPEIRHRFFSTVVSGIEDVAYEAGYIIMVCQSQETLAREIMNTRALLANRVAGLIVAISTETTSHGHLEDVLRQGLPLVQFDRVVDTLNTNKVIVDDRKAAYEATCHLIETGRRRIAHLAGWKGIALNRLRFEGYKDALAEHGLAFDPNLVVYGGYHGHDGRAGAEAVLAMSPRPDAILAINDPVAVGAHTQLRKAGVRIPEDIALAGFSDIPSAALLSPPLTTVFQPAYEMGKTAASLLLEQFATPEGTFSPRTVTLDTELRVRGSTTPVTSPKRNPDKAGEA